MMVRRLLRVFLLAVAFALATYTFGWWSVPLLAAAWGVMAHGRRDVSTVAAAAAVVAWGGLLLWSATRGPVDELGVKLGAALGLPPPALFAITLLFPALLAWSAALLASEVATAVARSRKAPP